MIQHMNEINSEAKGKWETIHHKTIHKYPLAQIVGTMILSFVMRQREMRIKNEMRTKYGLKLD